MRGSSSGPFFTKDPELTFRQNIRRALALAAQSMEQDVRGGYPSSGQHGGTIIGRVKSLEGKPWAMTAVVSQQYVYPWKNKGTRGFVGRAEAQYRGGKTEARYHMFLGARRNARHVLLALKSELLRDI